MNRIRDAIKRTETPSWIRSVPYDFGEAKAGTLKADEWRTLITIYIPLALILEWGEWAKISDAEVALRAATMLNHTMDLVCAVIIACRRTATGPRTERYRDYMKAYVEGIANGLYPDYGLKPNHHFALHIYDFLKLFGPIHSWWVFPFERLIGQLQRIPHNHRIGNSALLDALTFFKPQRLVGQLESTMHRTFVRAANMKRWIGRTCASQAVLLFKKQVFDRFFAPPGDRESIITDNELATATRVAIPQDLSPLLPLGSRKVVLRAHHRAHNVVYSRSRTHVGNSLIQFQPGGTVTAHPVAASIKYIYEREGKTRFAVQRQELAQDIVDPFLKWRDFPVRLYSSALSPALEEIEVEHVIGHCARYSITDRLVAMFFLSMVSPGNLLL